MTLMTRHMLYKVLGHTGAASAVLVVVVLLSTTQRLFYLLAEGAMSPGLLLYALALLVPFDLYEVVPLAVTIAVAHAYFRWSLSNEIVALRMMGLTDRRVALPGLGAAIGAMILTACMSLYLLPVSFHEFEDIRYAANFNVSLALLDEGYLPQIAPDLSMSFRHRLDAEDIEGVTILDGRKSGEFTYILAERARMATRTNSDGKRTLLLQRGTYQVRHGSEESSSPVHFEQMILPVSGDGSSEAREWRGMYEQHIGSLLNPPPEVRAVPNQYGEWIAEAHRRILMPLLCVSYVAFALGMLLVAGYQRASAPILRVSVALAGVGIWHSFMIALHSLVVRVPILVIGFYLAAAAPGAVGMLLLYSADRGTRGAAYRLAARLQAMVPAPAEPGAR